MTTYATLPTDREGREVLAATGLARLDALDRFGLTGVLTVDGIRHVRGWDVFTDAGYRGDVLVVEPTLARVTVRELGDLELALYGANARAQARRFLRAKVLEVAHTAGLPLRPFARPA